MPSTHYDSLYNGVSALEKTFLSFQSRPLGNYTKRQLALAAAYTVFCHAEIEIYLESWANAFVDLADQKWKANTATRPLVHMCTFHEGRNSPSSVPSKDIWNEVIYKAIAKHRGIIKGNHGIKEENFCEMFSPLGIDTTSVDSILLNDLSAFGTLRGDHAHNSHTLLSGSTFDPFDRRTKVNGLLSLLLTLDGHLDLYYKSP